MKRLLTGISAMAIGCLAFGEFADYTIHPGNGVTATVSEKISGPQKAVRAELIYNGTILMLK